MKKSENKCIKVYECYCCEKIGTYDHSNNDNGSMIRSEGDFKHKKCNGVKK